MATFLDRLSISMTPEGLVSDATRRTLEAAEGAAARGPVEPVTTPSICPTKPSAFVQRLDPSSCAHPDAVVYRAACTPQNVLCFLFKTSEFDRYSGLLRDLISTKPRPSASPATKTRWCTNVLVAVSRALDATNVPAKFQNNFVIDWEGAGVRIDMNTGEGTPDGEPIVTFPLVREFLSNLKSDSEGALGRVIDQPIATPLAPTLGGNFHSKPSSFAPFVPSNQYPANAKLDYAVLNPVRGRNVDREFFRVVSQQSADYWDAERGRNYAAWKRRTVSDPELFAKHMELHPGYGFAESRYRISTGSQLCFGYGPDSHHCNNYAWRSGFVMKADTTVDYCATWAREIIETGIERFCIRGVLRWFLHLIPYARTGQIEIPTSELERYYREAGKEQGQAGGMAAAQSTGGLFGELTGQQQIYAVFSVAAGFILMGLMEIFGVARGWSCPVLPFKRTVTDSACEIREVSGPGVAQDVIERGIQNLSERSGIDMYGALLRRYLDPEETGAPTPPPADLPFEEEPTRIPWTRYALIGGGILAGALVLRRVLR